MKVLVLHSELGMLRGGGENFVKNLLTEFARRGHEIHAAFAARPRGRYPVKLPASITPLPLSGWWLREFGKGWLSRIGTRIPRASKFRSLWDGVEEQVHWRSFRWYNQRFARRVATEFRNRWSAYDVIFVNGVDVGVLAAAERPTFLWLPGPLNASSAPQLRKIHAVSADGDAFLRLKQFLGEHITELSIGLEGALFKPGPDTRRASLGWGPEHFVFGYVGRLTHLKGTDILASAFREISRDFPQARLLVVGSGGSDGAARSTLKDDLASGLARFHAGVDDHDSMASLYRAMDAFVLPSRYENFSNALLEAAACGIPFIASDVGGNRILHQRVGGDLFAAGSVDDLVRCMRECINDPEPRRARAAAGSHSVRETYSWEASVDRLEWIFETRLGLKPGRRGPETAPLMREPTL